MAYHSIEDGQFWEHTTPSVLKHLKEGAQSAGFNVAMLPLGNAEISDPPIVIIVKFQPGGVLPRHRHACHRVEILVSGTLKLSDGRFVQAGTVMTSSPGEFYGPLTAGPGGAVTAQVLSSTFARVEYDLDSVGAGTLSRETLAHLRNKNAKM